MEFSDGKGNSVRPTSVTFPDAVFQNDPGGSTIYIKTGSGTGNGAPGSAGVAKAGANTYAAARLLSGISTGDTLYVFGRTTQSDGGQGLFTWVPGGTTSVNDGYQLSATGGIWRRVATDLRAEWFGIVGDNATDNGVAINVWIAAANELLGLGFPVKMVLGQTASGGLFQTTLRHIFPGAADVVFEGGTGAAPSGTRLIAVGSDETNPLMTHGTVGVLTSGRLQGIAVDGLGIPSLFYTPEYVGVRLLNKYGATHEILFSRGFYRAVQLQGGSGQYCAYNTITLGALIACKEYLNFNARASDTSGWVSQNTIISGDCQSSSPMTNYGSIFGWTFTEDYDARNSGHSGNFWYNPSFQIGNPQNTWTSTSAAFAVGQRIYTPKMGGEWLVKTAGTTGSTEPSILPAVVDKTNITVTAGSAVITMASTTGIVAGMHLRGTNPSFAFPVNTYVLSNDSGTQVTLTQPATAGSSSTTYHGSFVATTTDGSVTLVYLGPYRRSPVWERNTGAGNGIYNARWETGSGEALVISGTHLYPEAMTDGGGDFTGTFIAGGSTAINVCNAPVWASNTAYVVGDMVRPAVLGTVFWECIVAGTSTNGAEPTPANSTAGSTFVDTGVTWLIRAIRNTSNVDFGEYTGANGTGGWNLNISAANNPAISSAGVDNFHYRAIGSATGWRVKGLIKSDPSAVMTTDFAPGDWKLCRDGLSTTGGYPVYCGFLIDTSYNKAFILKRTYGAYTSSYSILTPLDADRLPLYTSPNQAKYHRRIATQKLNTGGYSYSEPNGGFTGDAYIIVNDEVKYVFWGVTSGDSDPPTNLGLSVLISQSRARTTFSDRPVQILTIQGGDYGGRSSLGTPTIGFFMCKGEYIHNASAVTGNTTPRGWVVTTAGILAPNWVTSTAYLKGALVTASGKVYAANGKFTSGTTPSGTGFNFLDTTATSINSGDVATWDYVGVTAVLGADGNVP